jgi:hypothetical protein
MIETLETELEYQKPGKYSTIKPLSSVKTLAAISFIKASISIGSIELRRKSMSGESFLPSIVGCHLFAAREVVVATGAMIDVGMC